MKDKPQHASGCVAVPAGFSGWWCERCDKPVDLPDELGSPARCPKCHKPTAVWIPPSAPMEVRDPNEAQPRERVIPRPEQARELFAQMRKAAQEGELPEDYSEYTR